MSAGNSKSKIPKIFISYSWDSSEHKRWVRDFAANLKNDGVDVILDQWEIQPGDILDEFMERSVSESDFVLIICTPGYKERSGKHPGGVRYEGYIMRTESRTTGNHRKFIPVLRSGEWLDASPVWLQGKYFIDLCGEEYSKENYQELLNTILGRRQVPRFRIKGNYSPKYSPPAPLITINISSSISKILDLGDASIKVPMIIDTGADMSYIPEGAIKELEGVLENKLPYGFVTVEDFNGRKSAVKTYELNIKTDDNTIIINKIECLEVPGEEGVLGRDFMNNFKICLNGPLLTFEIFTQ